MLNFLDKKYQIANIIRRLDPLLHFVAFFHVASLFVSQVENRKVGVDNRKVK